MNYEKLSIENAILLGRIQQAPLNSKYLRFPGALGVQVLLESTRFLREETCTSRENEIINPFPFSVIDGPIFPQESPKNIV